MNRAMKSFARIGNGQFFSIHAITASIDEENAVSSAGAAGLRADAFYFNAYETNIILELTAP